MIDNCETILAKLPDSPGVPLDLAEALVAVGRPAEALEWLEQHLAYRPGDSTIVRRILGDALLGVGRYIDAASAYARIPSNETDTDLCFARVRLAVMLGDEEQANGLLAHLGTARPAATDRDLARQVHAMLELGLTSEARGLAEAGAGTHPESLLARLHGDVAFAAKDWCAAQEAYSRAANLGVRISISARLEEAQRNSGPGPGIPLR